MSEDDATHMAAGVSYYALFSIFPLLLGIISLTSFALSAFVEADKIRPGLTAFATSYLPGSEQLVMLNLDAAIELRGVLGIFSIIGLLWSGSAVFGAITRAVNRAWDIRRDRPFYSGKPRQLLMGAAIGPMFLLSVGMATLARSASRLQDIGLPGHEFFVKNIAQALLQGSSLLLMVGLFLMLYKYLPNTRTFWRHIWPGALVAAILFELSKNIFIVYVNTFATFENIYGSLAPVVALLLWSYISSLILILGAELSSEYGRMREGVERGTLLHPGSD
ncbi:MAG: YihY/virulence factor BrkB family protein [Chloroflexi bacterium]|nr:YihY/virulence factor BrkB family protein [Chloroflexota bacterium]